LKALVSCVAPFIALSTDGIKSASLRFEWGEEMKIFDDQLIVITGGVGFIGSCLVRYLNDLGMKNLLLVDDLGKSDKWKNLLGKGCVDIIDKAHLFSWLEGKESNIEAIIHLGACSSTIESDASYLLENNYRYSVRLAEYSLKNAIRFIYASSAATYGVGSEGFNDDISQLDTLRPLNMYGMSKHLFDLWARNEGLLDKMTGLKFFNVFGPNEWHKGRMASAVSHMYDSILQDGTVYLFQSNDRAHYKDGEQKRDFVYVKDVVKMIYAFLLNDKMGIYNIASGVASSWNQLANAVFKAMDLPARIEYIPMPNDLMGKYQNYTCANMQRTRSALQKMAECQALEASVADYVGNHLKCGMRW